MSRKSSGSAAWLAHLVWDQRVAGSNPARSTRIRATHCIASEGLRRKVWGNRLLFELTALPCKGERKGFCKDFAGPLQVSGTVDPNEFSPKQPPQIFLFQRFSAAFGEFPKIFEPNIGDMCRLRQYRQIRRRTVAAYQSKLRRFNLRRKRGEARKYLAYLFPHSPDGSSHRARGELHAAGFGREFHKGEVASLVRLVHSGKLCP